MFDISLPAMNKFCKKRKQKFVVQKINGDYVFVSTRKKNKKLGSTLTSEQKQIRKTKNKQQNKSRLINRK